MKRILSVVAALLFAVALAACSNSKAPAEQALKAAEEALNAAKAEAMKYVPDQVKSVEDALKAAKDTFAKGDYAGATSAATAVAAKAKDLVPASAAKKAELTKGWEELNAGMPETIAAIQSRVDALSKSKKLPKNLDMAKLESVKSGLAEVSKSWDEASKAYKEGSLADALAKGKGAKEKAAQIMSSLGMSAPPTAGTLSGRAYTGETPSAGGR
jgi:DNA repair exonuclease SbcCD ATPase subunit